MPYHIFPNAFSEPKTRRGDVLSASLLHLRSRLPPCSAALIRVPSLGRAEAQCARAWPRVGVTVRLPVGLLPLPPALVPKTGPEPPCVYRRGLTQVCSAPPLRRSCCSGSSPEFRYRGPSVLSGCTTRPLDPLVRRACGSSGIEPLVMPYYIFPNACYNAFSEPKTRRGGVLSAYLLHLRSHLPPCSAVLLRVPSAEQGKENKKQKRRLLCVCVCRFPPHTAAAVPRPGTAGDIDEALTPSIKDSVGHELRQGKENVGCPLVGGP
jgi:hypothetical protein